MEEILRIAEDYYETGTGEEKQLFYEFFLSLDKDGNSRVSFSEFVDFVVREGRYDMYNRPFFDKLDRDRSGGLDFSEVKTLYYIVKSGRPICGQCKAFITGLYFTCVTCFNIKKFPFCVCQNCYPDTGNFRHEHKHKQFLDNFALLESKRKEALAAKGKQSPNQQITSSSRSSGNSTSLAIVPAPNPGRAQNLNPWMAALKAFELSLHLASVVSSCSIM